MTFEIGLENKVRHLKGLKRTEIADAMASYQV